MAAGLARSLERGEPESKQRLRLWLRLFRATSVVEKDMRRLLRARFRTTLPRFDLMAALERAPKGMTMGELSRRLMVTSGNVTPIVEALKQEGLVRRWSPVSDRRASYVALSERGRSAFREMAREHERWIDDLLGGLPGQDVNLLNHLLADIKHVAEARIAERAAK
jgi:DNA-binding MarR family transcriptional regulator